jgi:bifunctional DNase/RNase
LTIVRIARAEARPGRLADGRFLTRHVLVVLADDTGHRALPVWLERESGARSLLELTDEPEKDVITVGTPEELAARLLGAAGASVASVTISFPGEAATAGAEVLTQQTTSTRIELAGPAGTQQVPARLALALAVAAAAGAPVRVADAVMDRMAVPAQGGDLADVFAGRMSPADQVLPGGQPARWPVAARADHWPVAGLPAKRPRFEPRNLAFADGLDRWDLDGSFLRQADRPHSQDYAAAAESGSAVLRSAVRSPLGSAALVQTIFADDYRGATVVFRGEIRTDGVTDQAGLRLEILDKGAVREDHGITVAGSSDWYQHEVRAVISGNANVLRFGIVLTGPGLVTLRGPVLDREA